MFAFINNEFIEQEKAVLGITDLSIQRGYGIFDFFRTSNFIPLFLDNHLDRFYNSSGFLRLQPPFSREELKEIIGEMITLNNIPDAGLKMILTGGYSADGYEMIAPNFIIIQQPVQMPDKQKFDDGMKIILHEYVREFWNVKSINYLAGVYLQHEVKQRKADDVLYHKDGYISEFPRANVFIVTKDNMVVTPDKNVLHGITRMKVLELAAKNYKVQERAVSVDELKNAAEVFLTSTTKRTFPVLTIDDVEVGNGKPGPVTTLLCQEFIEMEKAALALSAFKENVLR